MIHTPGISSNVHVPMYGDKSSVRAFNSCTICVGISCKIHDRTPDCHSVSSDGCDHTSQTSQLDHGVCQAVTGGMRLGGGFAGYSGFLHGSLMCLAYVLTCNPWVFVQPSTGRRSGRLVQEFNVCTV